MKTRVAHVLIVVRLTCTWQNFLNFTCLDCTLSNGPVASSIVGGGDADINIFVFIDHKNNRFQNELLCRATVYEYNPPSPIIELATALSRRELNYNPHLIQ